MTSFVGIFDISLLIICIPDKDLNQERLFFVPVKEPADCKQCLKLSSNCMLN